MKNREACTVVAEGKQQGVQVSGLYLTLRLGDGWTHWQQPSPCKGKRRRFLALRIKGVPQLVAKVQVGLKPGTREVGNAVF